MDIVRGYDALFAAQDKYGSDMVEFDPVVSKDTISEGDDGIWVRGWMLVTNEEIDEFIEKTYV